MTSTSESAPASRVGAWALLSIGIVLSLFAGRLVWLRIAVASREWTVLRVPIHLVTGESVAAHCVPERDDRYELDIEIPRKQPREELGGVNAGNWFGPPPGLRASFEVSQGGRLVAKGTTGAHLEGAFSRDWVSIVLAHFYAEAGGKCEVRFHIEDAVAPLREVEAALTFSVAIDHRKGQALTSVLGLILAVPLVLGAGIAFLLARKSFRRFSSSGPTPSREPAEKTS
jgi:hypothetical protein